MFATTNVFVLFLFVGQFLHASGSLATVGSVTRLTVNNNTVNVKLRPLPQVVAHTHLYI